MIRRKNISYFLFLIHHVNVRNTCNQLRKLLRKVHPSENVNEGREKERLGMEKCRILVESRDKL